MTDYDGWLASLMRPKEEPRQPQQQGILNPQSDFRLRLLELEKRYPGIIEKLQMEADRTQETGFGGMLNLQGIDPRQFNISY